MVRVNSAFTSHSITKDYNNKYKNKQILTFTELNANNSINSAGMQAMANYNKALISFRGKELPEPTMEFIKSLTSDPRNGYKRMEEITNGSDDYNWKYNTYNTAFIAFTEQQIKKADSIEELIKFRPDWKGQVLRAKFNELHPGQPLTIGQVPEALGGYQGFAKIAEALTKAINDQKMNDYSKNYNVPDITFDDKTFNLKPLGGGKTSKVPFLVTSNTGEKFIIKIDPNSNSRSEPFESCDSIPLQAMIDYYLTSNNCDNASKVYYFNDKYNAAIYEFVEKDPDQSAVNKSKMVFNGMTSNMRDLGALGVTFNDTIGDGNVFARNGKFIMVDNGHCTYSDPRKPVISQYYQELPNTLWTNCFMQ